MGLNPEDAYATLIESSRNETLLASTASLLQWDAEIMMPRQGVENRGQQMAIIAGIAHEYATDPKRADLLDVIEGSPFVSDPESPAAVNVREMRRDFDRATRVPKKLVEEMARISAMSAQSWAEARERNDFASFEPWLDKTFALAREKADALGHDGVRYDALLEDYEPGMTTAQLTPLFANLRSELVPLVESIRESQQPESLDREFPIDRQRTFSEGIATKFGFSLDSGRFDLGPHPFCTMIGPDDVRIALRYHVNDFASGLHSVTHETGHALYDLGLEREHYGTPMGSAASLGIHESQSRLWENLVGRSRGFWNYFYPDLQRVFPDALKDVTADEFRRSMNHVKPGLIRVEADEVTYNLHIIIRFELERALLDGDLAAKDLPGAWNERYQQYLGITPGTDSVGCLQDIHWSEALIAYFPTYTLGNIYAAQIFAAANLAVGPLDDAFSRGDFQTLREWLRQNIHRHGRRYKAPELVERATGRTLDPSALITSLKDRYQNP
jgi:carboxypeptidase Taq